MLIGSVYRLRVTNISTPEGAEGLEVFPTIEVIDRLYAPPGEAIRFAIPVELTLDDLKLALAGKLVTRVIYLEDKNKALPAAEIDKSQAWFEAGPGEDPLAAADALGRPVAILRLGGRLPDANPQANFFFGSPPYVPYAAAVERIPKPAAEKKPESPPADAAPAAAAPAKEKASP